MNSFSIKGSSKITKLEVKEFSLINLTLSTKVSSKMENSSMESSQGKNHQDKSSSNSQVAPTNREIVSEKVCSKSNQDVTKRTTQNQKKKDI